MSGIETDTAKLLQDGNRLERLLELEKQRRGLPLGSLVFVGMANIAEHWWCTQKAVLKSRAGEVGLFSAYLLDRITNARQLGLADKLPPSNEGILDVGREVTLADVERLRGEVIVTFDYTKPPEVPSDPLERGRILEMKQAEHHPRVRWNFPWTNHTVVGVADGLTNEFVYEYKTTRNRFLLGFIKPVALAQADLYGYFFQRSRKRVLIQLIEESKTETYDEPVDVARAEETLAAFKRVFPRSEGTVVPGEVERRFRCVRFRWRVAWGAEGRNTTRARAFFLDWPENQNGGS